MQQVEDRGVGVVELLHLYADRAAVGVVGGAWVRPHRPDGVPVDLDRLAGGARLGRVAGRIAAADVELVEAEVVRDFLPLGVEHVAVAVPDLLVLEALALLDDLLERAQPGGEVGDGDDPPGAAVVEGVGDLPRAVAAEELGLAHLTGEPLQRLLDRLVELAERLEVVVLGEAVVPGRPLDLEECLQRLLRELRQADLEGVVRVREERRIRRDDSGVVEVGRAADGVEDVCRERQVQHLLDEDAVDDLHRLLVRSVLDRVERGQVRRQRRVLELDRPLKVLPEVFDGLDGHGRPA